MDDQEYQQRKKAIFDGMSKRGQERILRIGYENWDPFQEPKDPRERIFSGLSQRAQAMVQGFCQEQGESGESVALQKELFELARGLLQGEARARVLLAFCSWYEKRFDAPGEGDRRA